MRAAAPAAIIWRDFCPTTPCASFAARRRWSLTSPPHSNHSGSAPHTSARNAGSSKREAGSGKREAGSGKPAANLQDPCGGPLYIQVRELGVGAVAGDQVGGGHLAPAGSAPALAARLVLVHAAVGGREQGFVGLAVLREN